MDPPAFSIFKYFCIIFLRRTFKTNTKIIKLDRRAENIDAVDQIIALSAAHAAASSQIKAIACLTETGSTPMWMSRVQSSIPIYAMTQNDYTSRRICLYKGVYSIKLNTIEYDHARANKQVIDLMVEWGAVKKGDFVINIASMPITEKGMTNMLKLSLIE